MGFSGFEPDDFAVFEVNGFDARMEAIRERVRPKLTALAEELAPLVSSTTGREFYPHVAAHARRRVNPPEETWMALSRSPRGYKRYAHFEVGISASFVFVRLVVKPEADDKAALAESLRQRGPELFTALRGTYIWAEHRDGAPDKVWPEVDGQAVVRLGETLTKKTAGFAIGRRLAKDDPKVAAREPFLEEVEATVLDLFPIYAAAVEAGLPRAGRPVGR